MGQKSFPAFICRDHQVGMEFSWYLGLNQVQNICLFANTVDKFSANKLILQFQALTPIMRTPYIKNNSF